MLLPMDKAKFHFNVAYEDQHSLPQAIISALADERNVDTEYTVFDIVRRSSTSFTRLVVQMGTETVHRRLVTGIPQAFRHRPSIRVLIECSREEFELRDTGPHWEVFRHNDCAEIKNSIKSILAPDAVVEFPRSVQWRYWGRNGKLHNAVRSSPSTAMRSCPDRDSDEGFSQGSVWEKHPWTPLNKV